MPSVPGLRLSADLHPSRLSPSEASLSPLQPHNVDFVPGRGSCCPEAVGVGLMGISGPSSRNCFPARCYSRNYQAFNAPADSKVSGDRCCFTADQTAVFEPYGMPVDIPEEFMLNAAPGGAPGHQIVVL